MSLNVPYFKLRLLSESDLYLLCTTCRINTNYMNPFTSINTLSFISLHPRGLSCGPVAKRSPLTDNRVPLLLIWH